jgi:hypothetical protein
LATGSAGGAGRAAAPLGLGEDGVLLPGLDW